VTTNASGHADFDVIMAMTVHAGENFAATATDPDGNTSEFSRQRPVFLVTNTNDSGPGSLRQAILDSKQGYENAVVQFLVPATDPNFVDVDSWVPGGDAAPDVFVIRPLSELPALDHPVYPVFIDARTQAALGGETNPFGPEIVLDGSLVQTSDGLRIMSDGNSVYGLNIRSFAGSGILISGARGNTVAGNYIGTDARGAQALPNGSGVLITDGADDNTIGGTAEGARNIISGNTGGGVNILGSGTTGNVVAGNYIGVDATGSVAIPTGDGVSVRFEASGNVIGGMAVGAGNVISGNSNGVYLSHGSSGNVVAGNYIGTDAFGERALGNYLGIAITAGAFGNTIGEGQRERGTSSPATTMAFTSPALMSPATWSKGTTSAPARPEAGR